MFVTRNFTHSTSNYTIINCYLENYVKYSNVKSVLLSCDTQKDSAILYYTLILSFALEPAIEAGCIIMQNNL